MGEPWHEANVIDGLDRLQSALAEIKKVKLTSGSAIERAMPGFFSLVSSTLTMDETIRAARGAAPCKWAHDGGVYCSMHKCYKENYGSMDDCPDRVRPTEEG